MKKLLFLVVTLVISVFIQAQQTGFKFDFGNERTANGYININPESKYTIDKGYGFANGSLVTAVDRGGNSLTGDYITSTKPFYFSVRLPDGNYNVKLEIKLFYLGMMQ